MAVIPLLKWREKPSPLVPLFGLAMTGISKLADRMGPVSVKRKYLVKEAILKMGRKASRWFGLGRPSVDRRGVGWKAAVEFA